VILRVLNFVVIAALVLAAAYVYRIKYEATAQGERLDKLRDEVRHERDKIASLRAQWGELDDPARIEALAKRFLKLKPVEATQFSDLDHLPDQPPGYMRGRDPIGGMIEHLEEPVTVTGSITAPPDASAHTGDASPPASGSVDGASGPTIAAVPLASGAHSP
jgi:cell division protein FtsL